MKSTFWRNWPVDVRRETCLLSYSIYIYSVFFPSFESCGLGRPIGPSRATRAGLASGFGDLIVISYFFVLIVLSVIPILPLVFPAIQFLQETHFVRGLLEAALRMNVTLSAWLSTSPHKQGRVERFPVLALPFVFPCHRQQAGHPWKILRLMRVELGAFRVCPPPFQGRLHQAHPR